MRMKADSIVFYGLIAALAATIIMAIVVVGNTSKEEDEKLQNVWGYQCTSSKKCERVRITTENMDATQSQPICHLSCIDYGTLWPMPTGRFERDTNAIVAVDSTSIRFEFPSFTSQMEFWRESEQRFHSILNAKVPAGIPLNTNGVQHQMKVEIDIQSDSLVLGRTTNESFSLVMNVDTNNVIIARIEAANYFGARHGLESLSQLIVYDEFAAKMMTPKTVSLWDAPVYPHRGILLDTARRYYSMTSLQRMIDTMGLVKLNVFHWHITDSQSFAMQLDSHPDLAKIGAYAKHKIYTPQDISELVRYARVRGVRIMPEFDAPSHVGEGWQFREDMVACYNSQPWTEYCVGPPCGQLDPTNNDLYPLLEDIYREMFARFEEPDVFHMGGDEVMASCWNTSPKINKWLADRGWTLEGDGFLKLWDYFQVRALDRLRTVANNKTKAVLWTSSLTADENVDTYLNKDDYIIHVWTRGEGAESHVQHLLRRGYELIMSNYEAFYFDCGFGSWVGLGNNWCAPYKGWHAAYENNLSKLAGNRRSLILGGEACLWSSISDETTLDSRLWPRASALAERLWSEPTRSYRTAEPRILLHREFLLKYGVGAESIQPEWCLQHEGECPDYDRP